MRVSFLLEHIIKITVCGLSLQDLKDPQVRQDWLQLGFICIFNAIRHLTGLILTWDLQILRHQSNYFIYQVHQYHRIVFL